MDNNSQPDWLSPSGQIRRREILRLALAAARRRRNQRRAIALGCIAVIIGCLCALEISSRSKPQPPRQVAIIHPSPTPPSVGVPIIFVQTDPDIVKRLAVPPQPPIWQFLTDDQLLQTLAAEGKPVGLAYVDGREVLWTTP